MVLTPQLLQAIKLLQMPNLELTQFIENELASNPLLERAEEREDAERRGGRALAASPKRRPSPATGRPRRWRPTRAPRRQSRHRGRQRLRRRPHRARRSSAAGRRPQRRRLDGCRAWARTPAKPPISRPMSPRPLRLRDHLQRQAAILLADPAERMIGAALIDALDEAGYFVGAIAEIAERLGAAAERVERVLLRMQTPRADRRLRPLARRMPGASAQGARPVRSGDAGADRATCRRSPSATLRCCAASAASTTRICAT